MVRWKSPIGFVEVINIAKSSVPPFKVGDAVEVLDGSMEWFLAKIIELPTETPSDGSSNGSPRSLQVVSVIESNVGYALCRSLSSLCYTRARTRARTHTYTSAMRCADSMAGQPNGIYGCPPVNLPGHNN